VNLIAATRASLGFSQSEFGRWLAEQVGRNTPYPLQRISDYERGCKSPRKNIRDVCMPIVAGEIASNAVRDLFREVRIIHNASGEELRNKSFRNASEIRIEKLRESISQRIIENTA